MNSKMFFSVLIVCVLFNCVVLTSAFTNGVSESACDDMRPMHGSIYPQTSPLPYKLFRKSSVFAKNENANFTLTGPLSFQGYFLLISDWNGKAKGRFNIQTNDPKSKTIHCHGNKDSAACHKNPRTVQSVLLNWSAPNEPGLYSIYLTIANKFDLFWTKKHLGYIYVKYL